MSNPADEPIRRARVRLGKVVDDKWRLDTLLGVGGMAAVYAATHRNGKRAALKILHPEVALDANVKARFLREGYVANRVGHPGAVSILDDDEATDGTVYLVMELLEGETLEQQCKNGSKLAMGDVLSIADSTLDVLVAAHAKGIIHRDLKPGNLFLMGDGSVKVLDFGIAQLREQTSHSPRASTTLSSMGTPGFMPAEQARGRWEEVDGRADLWAVGATMFNALTARYVHDAETVNEQLLAAMTKAAPPIRSIEPALPELVAAVIDRALAFDRADRWPDALSMQAAVRDAYLQLTGRSLSFSRRAIPRVSSVDLENDVGSAPTLSATDPTPPREAIAAPISTNDGTTLAGGTRPTDRGPGPARRRLLMGAGGAVVASLVGLVWIGRAAHVLPRPDAPTAGASIGAPPSIATSTSGVSSDTPSGTGTSTATAGGPAPGVALSGGVPDPESSGPASHGARPPHARPGIPAPSSAPAASTIASSAPVPIPAPPAGSVDIFGRRR